MSSSPVTVQIWVYFPLNARELTWPNRHSGAHSVAKGEIQTHRREFPKPADLIPSPCVVFDLAPCSSPGEGGTKLWGTPPRPPSRASPLQPIPSVRR